MEYIIMPTVKNMTDFFQMIYFMVMEFIISLVDTNMKVYILKKKNFLIFIKKVIGIMVKNLVLEFYSLALVIFIKVISIRMNLMEKVLLHIYMSINFFLIIIIIKLKTKIIIKK